MSKIKKEIKPFHSDGLIWIVYDKDGDPIQAWDCSEEMVKKHVLKFGWSYEGKSAFRSNKPTTTKVINDKQFKTTAH